MISELREIKHSFFVQDEQIVEKTCAVCQNVNIFLFTFSPLTKAPATTFTSAKLSDHSKIIFVIFLDNLPRFMMSVANVTWRSIPKFT
jgi:hypothetical protein